MRARLPATIFAGLQSYRASLLQTQELPQGCVRSQPKDSDGGHRRSTAHDHRAGCRGLLRTLRLPGGGPISMTGALAVVCWDEIYDLGSLQIGLLDRRKYAQIRP